MRKKNDMDPVVYPITFFRRVGNQSSRKSTSIHGYQRKIEKMDAQRKVQNKQFYNRVMSATINKSRMQSATVSTARTRNLPTQHNTIQTDNLNMFATFNQNTMETTVD